MSTRAIICTTDGPDKGCTTWDHDQHVDARHALEQDPDGWGMEYGDAALDEIERLRAENERLRALTTITDNMVERAADAAYENLATQDPRWNEVNGDTEFATFDGSFHFLETMRAALEAALTTKENEA